MIRVRRWVAAAVLGGAVVPITACNPGSETASGTGQSPAAKPAADIGGALYPGTAAVKPVEMAGPTADPIMVANAVVQNNDRVQIAAQVDAKIELLAVPLEPNEKVLPERVVYHPRDEKRTPFRKLVPGDIIRKDQYICRLDDQLTVVQVEALRKTVAELKLAIEEGYKAEKAQQEIADSYKGLAGVAKAEYLNNISLVARYKENRIQSQKELAKTDGDLAQAETQTLRYWIQSPINGRIIKILKNQGEFAKAGDAILEVQATDRVRIEGKLESGYSDTVRPGMRVLVEPVRPVSPTGPSVSHRQEVTSIAVTGHPGRPLVVSGGLDNAALVWDVTGPRPVSVRLPHPAGVRSVAATGKAVKSQLVATGGDDGLIRLWDVSNPDRLPTQELKDWFTDSHGAAVTALAFSPDGRFLASAAGRDVWVWSVPEKKRLYVLPGDHRDAVTAVRFTPQGTLVTAARDKAVRVWKLGDKGAALASLMDHRGGAVDVLGVSSDGGKVLFDKDAGRLDVVSLADERSVGSLQAGGGRFAGLALFSADDALILTAGGEADQRGELTVWEAPQPGGRAAERRRLQTRHGAAVTCAAFSPDPDKPFVVVGTADGLVSQWAAPTQAERGKRMVAEVVSVMPADARTVTLSVEMANPTDQFANGLTDRSLATVIITPGNEPPAPPAPAAPPPAPVVKPAGGPAPAGGVVPAGGVAPTTPRGPADAPPKSQPSAVSPSGVSIPPLPASGK